MSLSRTNASHFASGDRRLPRSVRGLATTGEHLCVATSQDSLFAPTVKLTQLRILRQLEVPQR
jgi:hypothetical protein